MLLEVRRSRLSKVGTLGVLTVDGTHEGYTLEPLVPIPVGTYQVNLRFSNKRQRMVPGILDVPGYTDIEIHWGNYPKDTEGCLLVGLTIGPGPDLIGSSLQAFGLLYEKIRVAIPQGVRISYLEG